VTPVDTRLEALGGIVFRTAKKDVEDDQRAGEVAALRQEVAQLQTELAKARADHKAKLQAKLDMLDAKLQHKLELARKRSEQIKSETEAKIHNLQKKAAKAQGGVKAAMDARIAEIRAGYEHAASKLKNLAAHHAKTAG
jgi:chromosome segregation ATPase